jgi:hypothetical protein
LQHTNLTSKHDVDGQGEDNERMSSAFWIVARLAVFALMVVMSLSTPNGRVNADWTVGLLGGVTGSIAFSLWFLIIRRHPGIDLTDPYSIVKPFFPANKYPVRGWLFSSCSTALAGAIGIAVNYPGHHAGRPIPGFLLGLGTPLLATLVFWSRRSGPST